MYCRYMLLYTLCLLLIANTLPQLEIKPADRRCLSLSPEAKSTIILKNTRLNSDFFVTVQSWSHALSASAALQTSPQLSQCLIALHEHSAWSCSSSGVMRAPRQGFQMEIWACFLPEQQGQGALLLPAKGHLLTGCEHQQGSDTQRGTAVANIPSAQCQRSPFTAGINTSSKACTILCFRQEFISACLLSQFHTHSSKAGRICPCPAI